MKWTMEDFKAGKFAVRVGQKHVREFLKMCEEEGILWSSGRKAMKFVPYNFGENLAIIIDTCIRGNFITYGNAESLKASSEKVVDFEDFAKRPANNKHKSIIEFDGDTLTARVEVNGKEVLAKTEDGKRMSKQAVIDSLRDQAEDKRLLANGEEDSVFTEDAEALDAAVEMLENGCKETGKWVTSSDVPDTLICSVCHEWFDMWHYNKRAMHYCPRCGAKNGQKGQKQAISDKNKR